MPSVQQLRYLVALADSQSFTRAADICGVRQPSLSMQLKELEAKLNVTLVERSRSRVIITPVGLELAKRARDILASIEDMREIARQLDPNAVQAGVQIGVTPTVGAYVLSVAIPALRQEFPLMRWSVREDRHDVLLRQLHEGMHDIVLTAHPMGRGEFIHHGVMDETFHLVMPHDHSLAQKSTILPDDLAGETVLSMADGPDLHALLAHFCAQSGAILTRDYEGTTLDTLRQMVAAGMGVSLLPMLYVRSEVMREQQVIARPLAKNAPRRRINAVWRTDSARAKTYQSIASSIEHALAGVTLAGQRT